MPPPPTSNRVYRRQCTSATISRTSSASSSTSCSSSTSSTHGVDNNKRCHICKRSIKGRRGLSIHLGRSPQCKRNCPKETLNPPTLPRVVSEIVHTPSTSVDSLCTIANERKHPKFEGHGSNNCLTCNRFSFSDRFVSSSSHRIHRTVIPDSIKSITCKSGNVIYLITCRKCSLQYTGETVQELHDRIGKHRRGFNKPESSDGHCRILTEHFSQGFCKGADFTVNVIQKLPGDGRIAGKQPDPAVTRIRKQIETDWMLKLRTVYPYGLNDRIGDEFTQDVRENIFRRFPSLPRLQERYKVRTRMPTSSQAILDNFIYIVNESIRTNIKNTMNLIRVLLSTLKRSHCKRLIDTINDYIDNKADSYLFYHFFEATLDLLQYKIGNPSFPSKAKKAPPSNCCHIFFDNKAIDFINIQRILRDKDVLQALPPDLREDSPTVIFRLDNPIRSKLFNYKDFVQNLDVDAFLRDNTVLPCSCEHSSFTNPDHKHVISGDLNIIGNAKLRNLVSKGPKYREPVPFSSEKATNSILSGIDACIDAWSNKVGIPVASFKDWRELIILKINQRLTSLDNRPKKHFSSVLKDPDSSSCLADLQSNFVMVPIDKAANNVAFICKRYYAQVLVDELGLTGSPSSTYSRIHGVSTEDIISRHKLELKNNFKISIADDMLALPDIYWTPKLHKNPVKPRFIIASKKCTIKTLSKNLSSIFTLFQKQIEMYYTKTHFYSGFKAFWIVKNRDPVIKATEKSRLRKSAKSLSSFDFSTLYTKIPHDKLIEVLNKQIDFAFRGGTRQKITVLKSGIASWVTKDSSKSKTVYSKGDLSNAVSYLINNAFFKLGNHIFRQDIGIPMGSDPAPAFANLFLFHYESTWLNSIKKTNPILARKFGQVFRYIDDLLTLNDGQAFENHFREIYPEELELTKENLDTLHTNFLDLAIEIIGGVFTTKLYDKRDNFGFNITRLPFRKSNIPDKMFYSSIAAECLRICRATSASINASTSIHSVTNRMLKQGANLPKMKNSIIRLLDKHKINDIYDTRNKRFTDTLFTHTNM